MTAFDWGAVAILYVMLGVAVASQLEVPFDARYRTSLVLWPIVAARVLLWWCAESIGLAKRRRR